MPGQPDSALITSFLILRAPAPTASQLLCTIGFATGVATFFYGLRLRRRVTTESATARQQIIRLSPDPAPTKSSDMTQQQKIAAALARAGISNSAAWTQPASEITNEPTPTNPPQTHHKSTLLLCCGLALALASIVLFITIH